MTSYPARHVAAVTSISREQICGLQRVCDHDDDGLVQDVYREYCCCQVSARGVVVVQVAAGESEHGSDGKPLLGAEHNTAKQHQQVRRGGAIVRSVD